MYFPYSKNNHITFALVEFALLTNVLVVYSESHGMGFTDTIWASFAILIVASLASFIYLIGSDRVIPAVLQFTFSLVAFFVIVFHV